MRTEQRLAEYHASDGDARVGTDQLSVLCAALLAQSNAECIVQKYEKQQQFRQDRRDLRAQEEMSLWALGMLILTALALAALIASVYYMRLASDYTLDMLNEAKKTATAAWGATKAAEETVLVTREVSQRQLRPFLSPRDVVLDLSSENAVLKFSVCNSGPTAAYDVSVQTVYCKNGQLIRDTSHKFGIVDPGLPARGRDLVTPDDGSEVDAPPTAEDLIEVEILIEYEDVFGNTYVRTEKLRLNCTDSIAPDIFGFGLIGGTAREERSPSENGGIESL